MKGTTTGSKEVNEKDVLIQILERLSNIEKLLAVSTGLAGHTAVNSMTSKASSQGLGELKEKLKRLTIKRHAVLTATLGDVSYQKIASFMKCDETTVKLHLKAAMQILGVESRSILLASHKHLLDGISDKEYEGLYGLSKRWWMELKPELMAVLTATKAAVNQYSKPATKSAKKKP